MNKYNNLWQQLTSGKPKIPYIRPSDIDIASLFDKKKEEIKDNTKKQYVINT